jgi:hypothetical protein
MSAGPRRLPILRACLGITLLHGILSFVLFAIGFTYVDGGTTPPPMIGILGELFLWPTFWLSPHNVRWHGIDPFLLKLSLNSALWGLACTGVIALIRRWRQLNRG